MIYKPLFLHRHPYEPFLFESATKLIVGTLPPPRFTTGDLKENDVDFCYGSQDGQLWPILDAIFGLGLTYANTEQAVAQRKDFLLHRKIGICDIVESAHRVKMDASDLGMQDVVLRNLVSYLKKFKNVDTLLFTGGNSKNGPEYFFRKQLKEHNLEMVAISEEVPRIHQFILRDSPVERVIKTVSLTAPSGAANRAVGSLEAYKRLKEKDQNFTTLDFRVMQYRPYF